MSFISLLCFIFWGKQLIHMFISPSGGDWDLIGFIYPSEFNFYYLGYSRFTFREYFL